MTMEDDSFFAMDARQLGIDYLTQLDANFERTVAALQGQIDVITEQKTLYQRRVEALEEERLERDKAFRLYQIQTEAQIQLQSEEIRSYRSEYARKLWEERVYWTKEFSKRKQTEIIELLQHIEDLQERLQRNEEELWRKNSAIHELKDTVRAVRHTAARKEKWCKNCFEMALLQESDPLYGFVKRTDLKKASLQRALAPSRDTYDHEKVVRSWTESSYASPSPDKTCSTVLKSFVEKELRLYEEEVLPTCDSKENSVEYCSKNTDGDQKTSCRLQRELAKLRKKLSACERQAG